MTMSPRVLACHLAAMFVLAGFCFAAEPAKAQDYYGGCGYGCGSYAVAPFYGCGSCGVGFSYAPAPGVVQPAFPNVPVPVVTRMHRPYSGVGVS